MAHLLMIESWVGASGRLLPPLLRSLGHTFTFVTRKTGHYESAHSTERHPVLAEAREVLVTETNDVAALIEFLRPKRFDGVITVCDYYIETVQQVAAAFGLPCPFPTDVTTVRQKHRMREALTAAGVANPAYRLTGSWEETRQAAAEIGYPLVMKAVDLASSAFVNLVEDVEQLRSAYEALEAFPLNFRDQPRDRTVLLEAYMVGEEVSVECVFDHGETTVIGVTDKSITGSPYFIENGHMFPAALSREQEAEVVEYVQAALRAVGFDHGIAHTEVKLTADGPRIVEINPRTPGNYIVELIERVTGVDLLRAFVDLSLGERPQLQGEPTGAASAAVMFLVPPQGGKIAELAGIDRLERDPHVVRHTLENCAGREVAAPIDNACYLGHVVTEDREGAQARRYAEEALARAELRYAGAGEPV
ncbi:ATP-grasp domain-containing protein [Paenibacillus sp. IB182496]|uniref:ATP-grasp domain-containing protein n=1 Tax=Paenibacillus sabuli TaxID=2772509 RepID=A0A927GUG6_9BACL|nr:ATP-grasp domain-containing protein [Paenibacillus sabuli]MBD2847682.1 ATP-grasp domain-containing protein [Paenibacillus sabuli]